MIIIPKVGFYLNKKTNKIFLVDKVTAGQNEIYGFSKGVKVISDYSTTDEFEYLGKCTRHTKECKCLTVNI